MLRVFLSHLDLVLARVGVHYALKPMAEVGIV